MKKRFLFICCFIYCFMIGVKLFAIDGMIIPTLDYAITDKWNKTLSETTPKINRVSAVCKKQYFLLPIFFTKCSVDKENKADISCSIKIISPDKSEYFSQENIQVYKGKIKNENTVYHLSSAMLKICFEPEDKFGKYKILVTLNDKISGKSKPLDANIELKKMTSYKNFNIKKEKDISEWLTMYYTNPEPEKTTGYFLYYINSDFIEDDNAYYPIFSFFLEVFKNNKFLHSELLDAYFKQDENRRRPLLFLLANLNIEDTNFEKKLTKEELEFFIEERTNPIPSIYG